MPAQHAKLSPSGAKLDLKCPGNRREQARFPRRSTEASARGTGAHAVGEVCLLRNQDAVPYIDHWCGETAGGDGFVLGPEYTKQSFEKGTWSFKVDAKMAADVQLYLTTVRDICAVSTGCTLEVEGLSVIDANRWGTCDASIAQPGGTLHVVDYKNGVTYVPIDWNPQLLCYALGITLKYMLQGVFFKQIFMTIVQPNTMEDVPVRTFGPLTPDDLLNWHKTVLQPADKACLDPNAPLIPGNWCKDEWCDARHDCPALLQHNNEIANNMFSVVDPNAPSVAPPAPMSMTPAQRARILDYRELVKDWLDQVFAYEHTLHVQGKGTWGKLIKGRNDRRWANEQNAASHLSIMLHGDTHTPGTLKSPAQAEIALQNLGYSKSEAKNKIADMVSVVPGRPRLVSADAKGTPVNLIDEMFSSQFKE